MMLKFFRGLLSKRVSYNLVLIFLRLHNVLYKIISELSIISNEGRHPKHQILNYELWFNNHVELNDIVLDIGSNTGEMVSLMSKKAKHVYGIELELRLVAQAKKKFRSDNISFIHADATTFNYDTLDPVSVITLSNVLEHIENRVAFLRAVINNISWNEKKKLVLIRVPCFDRDWLTPYKKNLGIDWRLDKTHFVEYTELMFRNEVNEAGLDIVDLSIRFGEIYAVCSLGKRPPIVK